MAERVGFEPTELLRVQLISNQSRSAAPAPLQIDKKKGLSGHLQAFYFSSLAPWDGLEPPTR